MVVLLLLFLCWCAPRYWNFNLRINNVMSLGRKEGLNGDGFPAVHLACSTLHLAVLDMQAISWGPKVNSTFVLP